MGISHEYIGPMGSMVYPISNNKCLSLSCDKIEPPSTKAILLDINIKSAQPKSINATESIYIFVMR